MHQKRVCDRGSGNVSGGCQCRSSPLDGANSAPSHPLAGFEGPLRGVRKRGEREERAGLQSGRNRTQSRNEFLVTALKVLVTLTHRCACRCRLRNVSRLSSPSCSCYWFWSFITTIINVDVLKRHYHAQTLQGHLTNTKTVTC